jgi:hypothetical protein
MSDSIPAQPKNWLLLTDSTPSNRPRAICGSTVQGTPHDHAIAHSDERLREALSTLCHRSQSVDLALTIGSTVSSNPQQACTYLRRATYAD